MARLGGFGIVGAVLLAGLVSGRPAAAYTAAGDRLFPATLVLPQIGPSDEFYLNFNTIPLTTAGRGSPSRMSNLTATYSKTITDRLGISIEETYTGVDQLKAGTLWGWQNLDGEIKFLAVNDLAHEFLFTVGLDRETGGTGARRVGASPAGATTPRVYFGKGFGDTDLGYLRPIAISGLAGVQLGDTAARPDIVTAGFAVEYSIPYLASKVASLELPDLIRGVTPITEVLFTTPAGRSLGARTTALIAPGFGYAGEGWEFGVEALIPASRATGSGVGAVAQIHWSLDFLFPDTLGKPLLSP